MGLLCGVASGTLAFVSQTLRKSDIYVPVVLMIGESNAGGYALNSELTAAEAAARPHTKILNNTSLKFEALDIGTNNLIGHFELTDNATHGLENAIANSVESGVWRHESVYIVKCGQGTSTVAQWANGGAYWTTAKARIAAAKSQIAAIGRVPQWYVFYSQGVNDHGSGTPAATWQAATIEFIGRIRAELGVSAPIAMTRLPPTYSSLETAITSIAASMPRVYPITTSDAALLNVSHWSSAGLNTIGQRVVSFFATTVGESEAYAMAVAAP